VQRFACAGERHARDQSGFEASRDQAMRQAAVIITGWLEANDHRPAEASQGGNQTVVLCASIRHGQPPSAHARPWINENFMAILGNVDGYKRRLRRRTLSLEQFPFDMDHAAYPACRK
jgi:hypothetical protein